MALAVARFAHAIDRSGNARTPIEHSAGERGRGREEHAIEDAAHRVTLRNAARAVDGNPGKRVSRWA